MTNVLGDAAGYSLAIDDDEADQSADVTISDNDTAVVSVSSVVTAGDETASEDSDTGLLTFSLADDDDGTNSVVVDTITTITFTVAVSADDNNVAGDLTADDFSLSFDAAPLVGVANAAGDLITYTIDVPANTSEVTVTVTGENEAATAAIAEGDEVLTATITAFDLMGGSTTNVLGLAAGYSLAIDGDEADQSADVTISDNDTAVVSVSSVVTADDDAASEAGDTGLLTFSLADNDAGDNSVVVDTITTITFTVAVSADDNNVAGDLTADDFSLSFDGTTLVGDVNDDGDLITYTIDVPANTSDVTVTVTGENEAATAAIAEGDEVLTATITAFDLMGGSTTNVLGLAAGYSLAIDGDVADQSAALTINDNDTAVVSVAASASPIDEGGTSTLTFSLADGTDSTTAIAVDTDTEVTFSIPISAVGDLTATDFALALDGATPEGSILVLDMDNSTASLEIYILTIPAGQNSVDVTLTASGDTLVEGDETVTATITSFDIVGGGSVAAGYDLQIDDAAGDVTPSAAVVITDDDFATWSIADNNTTTDFVAEASTASYLLSLSGNLQANETASVDLAISFPADAASGDDAEAADFEGFLDDVAAAIETYNDTDDATGTFSLTGNTLTYTHGEADGTVGDLEIVLSTVDDSIVEGNEDFTITITEVEEPTLPSSTGADVRVDAVNDSTTTTITDNDTATVSFVLAESSVSEGDGTQTVEVMLTVNAMVDGEAVNTGTLQDSVSVTITNDQTQLVAPSDPAEANDYMLTGPNPVTFVAGAGTSSQLVTLTITQDTDPEPAEDVHLELVADPENEAYALNDDQDGQIAIAAEEVHIVTILNDDIRFSIDDVTMAEGDSGTTDFTFTITRSDNTGEVSVDYSTADSTATSPSDYASASGTVTFLDGGVLSQTVTISVAGDDMVELNEQFFVNLSNAVGGEISDGQGVGTILNDDSATVSIDATLVGSTDLSQVEGDSGNTTFTYTARLSNPVDTPVLVTFNVIEGTATFADDDLQTTAGTIGFAPGEIEKTFTVLVGGDTRVEVNETFTVDLDVVEPNARDVVIAADADGGLRVTTIENEDVNIAPVAISDFGVQTMEDTPRLIDVVGNDIDIDGTIDRATVAIVAGPGDGTATVDTTTGVVTYAPNADFSGTDSFTYTVADNEGAVSNEATVFITVDPVNDAPVATGRHLHSRRRWDTNHGQRSYCCCWDRTRSPVQ